MIYIIGHKNPDTDSVCSAIAYSELKRQQGVKVVPARLGELNPETTFVLNKFGFKAPELLEKGTGKELILVDHNEKSQSLVDLDQAKIVEIIDHHKIGDITTPHPIFFLTLPVGSTATIVTKLFEEKKIKISKNIAAILLASIISDTVLFKSVTTTGQDKVSARRLAEIAGVENIEELGMEILKAKSDLAGKSPKELLFRDFKDFDMSGYKVGIGQIEVVDSSLLDNLKDGLYEEMGKVQEKSQYDSLFLMLTDVIKECTELLVVTDNTRIVEEAFGKRLEGPSLILDKVLSRKKQVVPPLEKAFAS